jgi:hypothetical protein
MGATLQTYGIDPPERFLGIYVAEISFANISCRDKNKVNLRTNNCEFYIQEFEQAAVKYYGEMVQMLKEFTIESIANILLACGVHWIVNDEESNVPGTYIPWATLIQKSLIFPYLDRCYTFPLSLVCRVANSTAECERFVDII